MMKTLMILFSFLLVHEAAFSVCLDAGLNDPTGTSQLETTIEAVQLSSNPNQLSSVEKSLLPDLQNFFGNDRNEIAVNKVIDHFDDNGDGVLERSELVSNFTKEPFEFSYINSNLGASKLIGDFGNRGVINKSGVRDFVKHYGFY